MSKDFILLVKITPKSSVNKIIGWENDILKIKIKAPPEKNKANQELIKFLSKTLSLSQSSIKIIKGLKSRNTTLKIASIDQTKTLQLINL